MSVLTLRTGAPFAGLFHSLSRLAAELRSALDAQHDYERMQALSDRQLDAMGLSREDLPRVVFERHFR